MVEWRPLIISIFFALAIYIVSLLGSLNGSYLAVLLGGALVGYMIDGTMKEGVIHGAIIGLIIGVVGVIIQIAYIAYLGYLAFIGMILYSVILALVISIVIGLIGGILGVLINSESLVSVDEK